MATFTNQAQLTYDGRTVASNTVTGQITQSVTMTKIALTDEYAPDDTIAFVVTLTNSGQTAITDLTLTDDLGAYPFGEGTAVPLDYTPGSALILVNGTPQTTPPIEPRAPLTLTGISVPAGGNTVIVYETTTNAYTPVEAGGSVTNTVTATSPGLAEELTASETVTVESGAVLSVVKALSPATVVSNGTVTYTFTVENTGNAAAPGDTVITDVFDPILSAITVSFNGTPWTEGTEYTYDETTGAFATVAGSVQVDEATFSQDTQTGEYTVEPGSATLVVTGTI